MPHIIDSFNSLIKGVNCSPLSESQEKDVLYYYQQIRWRYYRLFLIGWFKGNVNDGCLLPILPRDILRVILDLVDQVLVCESDKTDCVSCSHSGIITRLILRFELLYLTIDLDYMLYFNDINRCYITYHCRRGFAWLKLRPEDYIEFILSYKEEVAVMEEVCRQYFNRSITMIEVYHMGDPYDYCDEGLKDKTGYDLVVVKSENNPTLYYVIYLDSIINFIELEYSVIKDANPLDQDDNKEIERFMDILEKILREDLSKPISN